MSKQQQLVILVDWHASGHNASYLCEYSRALSQLGFKVAIVCTELLAKQILDLEAVETEYTQFVFTFALPRAPRIRPRKLQHRLHIAAQTRAIVDAIRCAETSHGSTAKWVCFSTVLEEQAENYRAILDRLDREYFALYLHPRRYVHSVPPRPNGIPHLEPFLRHPRLKAIGTLNEDLAESIAEDLRKPVLAFPDVTDSTTENCHPLAQRVRRFAGDRKVVGLISLAPWKGVGLMARACRMADPEKYVFFFAGQFKREAYDPQDAADFEFCMTRAPHAFFHLAHLPSTSDFNAAMQACDVLACVCKNMPFSNNSLTKAAVLRRPVVVAYGTLSATRVSQHALGAVVDPDSPQELLLAIEQLCKLPDRYFRLSGCKSYTDLHCPEMLQKALKQALSVS